MRIAYGWCVAIVLLVGSVAAAAPEGRVLQNVWEAAHLEGGKAGFVHTTVREVERDGTKLLSTTTELELTVRRFGDIISLRMETGTVETPEGKVTEVSMKQFLGKQQQLVMTGTVEGNQLHVRVKGSASLEKKIPWNDQVLGLYRQQLLFKDRKVKAGDSFSYLSYEPQLTTVLKTQVTVKDYELVEVLKTKKRLLRVEALPDKIEVPGSSLELPPLIVWLDKDLETIRSQVEMPGLGEMVLYRTTKEEAKKLDRGKIVDIGLKSLITVNRRIDHPYDSRSAVYRITLKGSLKPAAAFAQDGRQQIKNVKGNTFELHVQASREPQPSHEGNKVSDEFLKSCYFIKCDDPKVKEHTRKAVRGETDPWKKALRIEKYVHEHIEKNNYTEAFATADEVARTMEGDCTEHSVLAAAMCRAAGIPSRTALGLVYVDHRSRGPVMGFHMWTEVWIGGQWLPIDATLGRGYVGAAHLKITDHSWYDTQSLTPLVPVLNVLGKLSIEVIRVEGTD